MATFDVIVIGAGHAGSEAAYAAAQLGCHVGLCTLSPDTVAHMPCNPAIGGTAKGHLVREIDALGGLMGRAIDETGIQFKLLNRSRGPAVWSPRAQADKSQYSNWVRAELQEIPAIEWLLGKAERIVVEGGRVAGIELDSGKRHRCKALVVTTGTFLNGLIHVGRESWAAGRAGEPASRHLAESLKKLGFTWGRLKTGTPPRVSRESIDFSVLHEERGDKEPVAFSFMTDRIAPQNIVCHLAHTNEKVHELVSKHLSESPLFNGQIKGIGPRYCPSLEDKIVRFPDRDRHQIFLEPEGIDVPEVYVNGFSTSLPRPVQEKLVHALPGMENAEILRHGYAVEYDFIQPTELNRTLESRRVPGLFLAGQLNGTSGYEEAAAQGLVAGLNAARQSQRLSGVIFGREEAYIGVLIDDLTTKGCLEPYRMFTSRAEYRLLLRIDNADLRLTPRGRTAGTVSNARWERFVARRQRFKNNILLLNAAKIKQSSGQRIPAAQVLRQSQQTLVALQKRGAIQLETATEAEPNEKNLDLISVQTEVKYEGYLKRQKLEIERTIRQEGRRIPQEFKFEDVPGLTSEVTERLRQVNPETLGQALRVPGVTPAAVAIISFCLDRPKFRREAEKSKVDAGNQLSRGA